ncbi:MAG TPA: T9SS type A sorting domain-containing protein [Ignavibacteriaceae bacterium]|nr:T9SS type A sorting domain-containing protein [Ignavibacteriaceae bacterium]
MKKIFLYMLSLLAFTVPALAQLTPVDSVISGHITANRTLTASKKYLLSGFVYVDSTFKLTIPAGTILFGEKDTKGSLIIKRGAKLIAIGTPSNPIIMTSQQPAGLRAPGDWGGLILCGAAKTNRAGQNTLIEGGVDATYGGTNDADSSGVLRYIRIEFPGYAFQPNNEINGLTMGAVGSKTVIDHIQVSFSLDDSYEWFGGSVTVKYLVAYKGLDDDFDTDFGFHGKGQFCFSIRDPWLADQSNSESFESDNNNDGIPYAGYPRTSPKFSNFTCVGPKLTSSDVNVSPQHFWAVHQRRGTQQNIFNTVFLGYRLGGIKVDDAITVTNIDSFKMKNIIMAGTTPVAGSNQPNPPFDPVAWFNTAGFNNSSLAEPANVLLRNPYNPVAPDLTPNAGSPVLGAASFTDLAGDPFFTQVTYAGAFANNNDKWDAGWTNYDPQSTNYNTGSSWTSTIKVINSLDENAYVVFGRGTGATDGVDASFGEDVVPPAGPNTIDARWVLPSGVTDQTFLDVRNTGAVAGNRIKYKLQVNAGDGTSIKLSWDPNYLTEGRFTLIDSLGGALFANTNMKTTANVTFTAASNTNYTVYIYFDTKFSLSNLSVGNGWNMLSFPGINAAGMAPAQIWNPGQTGTVYSFNGAYQPAATINPGIGYWVKISGARVYTTWNTNVIDFVPKVPTSSIAGWNIVGVYDYSAAVSGLTTVPANVKSGLVYGFVPGSGYQVVSNMDPGKAYWIRVTAAGQIRLAPQYSGLAKTFAEEFSVDKAWGKISVVDADGNHYALYSANSGANLSQYDLPPMPPAGVFDVRFGSQRFAEDLSATQIINFSGARYPVRIRVEGVSLKVTDISGKLINKELASGEELVISNENISSLKVSTGEIIPSVYQLSQNYPNPFNPSTTIKVSIPATSGVKLTIYNALGQQVAELVNQVLEAGNYNFNWDASKVSSGVYFYQLKAGEFSAVKKMMFLK